MTTFTVTTVERMTYADDVSPAEIRESVLGRIALRSASTRTAAEWVRRHLSDEGLGSILAGGREVFQLDSWHGPYSTETVWRIAPAV